jgi:predicted hydrocarbon binding protein
LITPSQASLAVAGVQPAPRQHRSLVPFFQVMPVADIQLSFDFGAPPLWLAASADIGAASATDANSAATLFSFFIDSPLEESRSGLRDVEYDRHEPRVITYDAAACASALTIDEALCHGM